MYIEGITNSKLIKEVTRRLKDIDTEYIFSSSDVEMLIEDTTYFPMTRTLKTERPDRVASMLVEGKDCNNSSGQPICIDSSNYFIRFDRSHRRQLCTCSRGKFDEISTNIWHVSVNSSSCTVYCRNVIPPGNSPH